MNIFVKDLGIVLDTGRELSFPLPLSASAHQLFMAARSAGLGGEDDAAVIKVFQALSGITLPGDSDVDSDGGSGGDGGRDGSDGPGPAA